MPELLPNDKSVTVGITVTAILDECQTHTRKLLNLRNTSTAGQIISLGFGRDASAGVGIVLYPGDVWNETTDPAFDPTGLRVSAIADVAGATLAVSERIE